MGILLLVLSFYSPARAGRSRNLVNLVNYAACGEKYEMVGLMAIGASVLDFAR